MKSDLISALAAAEHPLLELEAQDGSLLILPYGARVLGLFGSSGENFFWVNPALTATASAKAFFASTGWKNSGGDRTWVAPETDFFIKNIDDPWNTYEVPSSIDPGNYTVQKVEGQVKMINQARVVLHNLKKECAIELEKTIRMVVNPLHHEEEAKKLLGQLEYIGYEQVTTLRLISPPLPTPGPSYPPLPLQGGEGRGVRLGMWNLIQLPAGGHIIIPTVKESYPQDYFEKTGPSHLRVTPRFIHFLLDANERHKIGVKAISTIGRVGYLRPIEEGIMTLVVRNVLLNPSGEYVDTPWDNRSDLGYAIQCYNDDGHLGKFGEMEYHAPAIGEGTGMTTYQDRSQVWAFWGKEQSVNEVCQYLLGAEIED
ncbi:hypothetical protein FJZ31_42790 [Candidatus Poribacteria bacterium]|nr:hypothetical protein [Candidatus Poribacteria bacterium]